MRLIITSDQIRCIGDNKIYRDALFVLPELLRYTINMDKVMFFAGNAFYTCVHSYRTVV